MSARRVRYWEAQAARESHDVRETASAESMRGKFHLASGQTYNSGYVGLQPRPWCQVLERAFGVRAEDCLFAVSQHAIYAVVADPKRARASGATPHRRAQVQAEIARLGVSTRRVEFLFLSRRRFEAATAAQRMGGDAAALAVIKPGALPAFDPGFNKSCASDPP